MGSLFQELKRRNVFKVAIAYAVIAFALAQAADLALPTFGAPEWVNQTLLFLLLLGFPLAVVLAWAYELTPSGIKTDAAAQSAHAGNNSTDRKLIYAILLLVLVVAGFQFSDRFLFDEPNSTSRIVGADSVQGSSPILRASIILDQSLPRVPGFGVRTFLSITPDGSMLAYSVPGAKHSYSH